MVIRPARQLFLERDLISGRAPVFLCLWLRCPASASQKTTWWRMVSPARRNRICSSRDSCFYCPCNSHRHEWVSHSRCDNVRGLHQLVACAKAKCPEVCAGFLISVDIPASRMLGLRDYEFISARVSSLCRSCCCWFRCSGSSLTLRFCHREERCCSDERWRGVTRRRAAAEGKRTVSGAGLSDALREGERTWGLHHLRSCRRQRICSCRSGRAWSIRFCW